jgi:hypothetical protein
VQTIYLSKGRWSFKGSRIRTEEDEDVEDQIDHSGYTFSEPHVVEMMQYLFDNRDAVQFLSHWYQGRIRVLTMDFDVNTDAESRASILVREEQGDGFFTEVSRRADIIRSIEHEVGINTDFYVYKLIPTLNIPEVRRHK